MRRLLLDFGGVVIKTPFEMLHRVGHPEWRGPFDPASDDLWQQMQREEISERDYWDQRAAEVFADHNDPVTSLMNTIFAPPRDEVVRSETLMLIDEVERPAVLTNDLSRFHSSEWLGLMGLTKAFDPLIDLSFTGYLKPDPRAYAHAIGRLGTPADQIVFADDQPRNVEGAIHSGLRAVWFDVTDPAASVRRIRAALR